MPDKKINQLDAGGPVIGTDLFPVNQNQATGKAVKIQASAIAAYVADALGTGAQIYFDSIVPPSGFGNDGDVYFDTNTRTIYKKISGSWVSQTTWLTSAVDLVATLRMTGPNTAFTSTVISALTGYVVLNVQIENLSFLLKDPAIAIQGDEYTWDPLTATLVVGSTQNAFSRMQITYAIP